MSVEETITVHWSSRLEVLAEGLLKSLTELPGSPFDKICIVVNDSATENWLKQYFLLERKIPQVLLNLKFVNLPEFGNDWLAALIHGISPRQRRATQHPYSPGVLLWRIYRILEEAESEPESDLQELLNYVGQERDPKRRFRLAGQLAKLYDDYQNSRCQMLRNWEKGSKINSASVPSWQIALYRRLTAERPDSYARDYEIAFSGNADAGRALALGFRHCRAIHVFDVSFMHEPMLRLLENVSGTIPVSFWCFTPQNDWLAETPSLREAAREHRKILQSGDAGAGELTLFDVGRFYDSPEERLLGALASGARAVLWNLCSDAMGSVDSPAAEDALAELAQRKITLHRTYSPRRELETIRDGLCDYFRRNSDASPGDAVILCADWENYAPVVEAVFGGRNGVPVTMAGGIPEDTPFTQSFKNLLAFRKNRFEVNAVFELLGFPAIREKFGLDAAATGVLRDMVRKANIHWGFDEADVRRILKMTPEEAQENAAGGAHSPWLFTWRRGFDRLVAEMLYGSPKDDETILDEVGTIRNLHPCGKVEADRAGYAAMLWRFVSELNRMRQTLAPETEYPVEELETITLRLLDAFYRSGEQTVKDMNFARKAIRSVCEAQKSAGISVIPTDVFLAAVEAGLNGFVSGMRTPGRAVLFAPLNPYTATPHRLVWICGLNDGAFPKVERRPFYDLIGRHPSFFDASPRERGAFALLKAVLCAREELALSYVGKNVRSNENVPPSVLLNDLMDYFAAVPIPVTTFSHPMHAYSQRYFYRPSGGKDRDAASLPPSGSPQDEAIAGILREEQPAETSAGISAFPLNSEGITEIQLEDLADFFAAPHRYLLESRGARIPQSRYDHLEDKETLAATLSRKQIKLLTLTGESPKKMPVYMMETGRAPDETAAKAKIESEMAQEAVSRALVFIGDASKYSTRTPNGGDETFAGAYCRFRENPPGKGDQLECELPLNVKGRPVQLRFRVPRPVELDTRNGRQKFLIFYGDSMDAASKNRIWLTHAGANFAEENTATFLFSSKGAGTLFLPLSRKNAEKRLTEALELAEAPLPPDFPDWEKLEREDRLPPELQQKLWTKADAVSSNQRGKTKKDSQK